MTAQHTAPHGHGGACYAWIHSNCVTNSGWQLGNHTNTNANANANASAKAKAKPKAKPKAKSEE